MKASITSTDQVVPLDPAKLRACRVWEGVTDGGVRFTAYVPVIQVATDADNSVFERELTEHKPADRETQRAINMRHLL